MTITSYPITPERIVIEHGLNLTAAEEKFILRWRQILRKGDRRLFVFDPLKKTLTPIDVEEIEELGNH